MKKIEIEKVLVKPQDIFGLKQIHTIDAKQRAFTDFFFWNQVGGCNYMGDRYYKNESYIKLFDEKYFRELCDLYGIKIDYIEKIDQKRMRILTNSSVLSTYLDEVERQLLRDMGRIGLSVIMKINILPFLNSSFQEKVWTALGYKVKNSKIIL